MFRHRVKQYKRGDHFKENSENFSYSKLESTTKSDNISDSDITQSMSLTESPTTSSWGEEEKKVFEDQLESLQDQLIAAVMQNQKLGNDLRPPAINLFSCFIFS